MDTSKTRQGELFLLGEILLWSVFPIVTLLTYNSLKPLSSLALSTFLASVFFGLILTKKGLWHEILIPGIFGQIIYPALFIGVFFYILNYTGLKHTTAGNASLVGQMEIFFSYLLFNVWKKESLDRKHLFGIGLMLVGAGFILLPKSTHFAWGDGIILLSTLFAPMGNFYQQKLRKKISAYTIMFWRSFLSFPIILAVALITRQGFSLPELYQSLWLIILSGVFLMGASKIFWIEAIHRIPVVKANALACIRPLLTLLLAYFFLKEIPTLWQILALLPLGAGVVLLTRPVRQATTQT